MTRATVVLSEVDRNDFEKGVNLRGLRIEPTRQLKGKKSKKSKKSKGKGSKKGKNSKSRKSKGKAKGKAKGKRSLEPSMKPSMEPSMKPSHVNLGGLDPPPTDEPTVDEYPYCNEPNRKFVGDGWCDAELNIPQCGWDGGDCPVKYPNCNIPLNNTFGDGWCDQVYNKAECGYDDGDCEPTQPDCTGAGNGYCQAKFNIAACSFDGGDCETFNLMYPKCKVESPWYIGDGICDGYESYNTSECGFDGGDCLRHNSTNSNTTSYSNRNLLESVLEFFYPQPTDEVLRWQK